MLDYKRIEKKAKLFQEWKEKSIFLNMGTYARNNVVTHDLYEHITGTALTVFREW